MIAAPAVGGRDVRRGPRKVRQGPREVEVAVHEAGRGGEDVGADEELDVEGSVGVGVPAMTGSIIIVVVVAVASGCG